MQRRFESIAFARSVTHVEDEHTLRELYNRLNFGGTPHTDTQKA
jgi:hypothetical protein